MTVRKKIWICIILFISATIAVAAVPVYKTNAYTPCSGPVTIRKSMVFGDTKGSIDREIESINVTNNQMITNCLSEYQNSQTAYELYIL